MDSDSVIQTQRYWEQMTTGDTGMDIREITGEHEQAFWRILENRRTPMLLGIHTHTQREVSVEFGYTCGEYTGYPRTRQKLLVTGESQASKDETGQ